MEYEAQENAPEITLKMMRGETVISTLTHSDEAAVTVKFRFTPGYPDIIRADPNDSEEGCADEVEIVSITADEDMVFFMDEVTSMVIKAGTEISDLYDRKQIQRLEETIKPELEEA